MSLRAKLLLPLLLIGILIGAYLQVFWIPRTLANDEAAHIKAVDQHLDSVVEALIPLLLGNQFDIIHENLNALKRKNAAWVEIRLTDAEGRQIYPLAFPPAPSRTQLNPDVRTLQKSIRYLGTDMGKLVAQVDLAPALSNTRTEAREVTIILLGILALLMTTITLTSELTVRRPVHQLAEASRSVAQGDFATPLPAVGKDEVGTLVHSFAAMSKDLQAYHAKLLHEIAERKDAEQALRLLNETLEQRVSDEVAKNREKDHLLIQQSRLAAMGEMVHNIAHQWRQPLNSLALLISNFRDDFRFHTMTEETVERDAATARRLIERMSSTIDDFRDFFRPDREEASFDVAQAVREAEFIIDAALKNNRIAIFVDAREGLTAKGFPTQYAQAVLNLLANAKEAIVGKGMENGEIHVKLEEANGEAVLTVEDNAGGIPDTILPKLFDPYFTTKDQGSGIGLYMVKMIIEHNMNGRVEAANSGKGACFTLSMPLEKAKL